MRYSMESALKLFLFVSLVTFSTVTLGQCFPWIWSSSYVVSMYRPLSFRFPQIEEGRWYPVPQIQFAKSLALDSNPLQTSWNFMKDMNSHWVPSTFWRTPRPRIQDWCFHGKIVGLGEWLGLLLCILVSLILLFSFCFWRGIGKRLVGDLRVLESFRKFLVHLDVAGSSSLLLGWYHLLGSHCFGEWPLWGASEKDTWCYCCYL